MLIFRFLLARYGVTWHRLRNLDHPLRIGDVLILPITAFSPGGEADFKSGRPEDRQSALVHGCESRPSIRVLLRSLEPYACSRS